jgi:hypothetical protein
MMLNQRILKLLKIINFYPNSIKNQRKNCKRIIKIKNIKNNLKIQRQTIKEKNNMKMNKI